MYRTAPLAGLWSHQKGGFYHDGRFATLPDVIEHYDKFFKLRLTDPEKSDLSDTSNHSRISSEVRFRKTNVGLITRYALGELLLKIASTLPVWQPQRKQMKSALQTRCPRSARTPETWPCSLVTTEASIPFAH